MNKRKPPLRLCVGCRTHRDKRELVRVVRTPEGQVVLDPTGKRNGRGAYLCRSVECLDKAVKSKALERALEHGIDPEVVESMRRLLADN